MATSTSSSTSTVATDRLLASATQLALLLPHMDRSDVLYAVGFSSDNADQGEVKKRLRHLVRAHCVQHGMPVFGTNEKAKEERAFKVFNLMQRNPEKSNNAPGKTIKLTEAMMFTGFSSAKAKSGSNEYQRIYRKIENQRRAESRAAAEQYSFSLPAVSVPRQENTNHRDSPLLSPITCDENQGDFGEETHTQ